MLNSRHSRGVRQPRREYWSQVIGEQKASGLSIRAFCKQRGISDHSFYAWRRRLSAAPAVRFAEVETIASPASADALELVLATGTRLLIPNGVDAATLRIVLDALRP